MPYPYALDSLIGQRFGRLTVAELLPYEGPGKGRKWRCLCDCGNQHVARSSNLKKGYVRSCGCLYRETRKALGVHLPKNAALRHGMSASPEYNIWSGLKGRCLNPHGDSFKRYGGRGITVCPEWANSFEAFLADMGPRPSPEHSIDRIDNNGPYAPWNCRWATPSEQSLNCSRNHLLTYEGRTQTVVEWAEETGINRDSIFARIRMGWSVEDALTKPLRKDRRRKP